jgi:hypothetical protein
METLTLNDGTVVHDAVTIGALPGLWVHITKGYTLPEAYTLFSNPEITAVITSDKSDPRKPDEGTVYEGYTDLYMLKREDDGTIVIGLHKGG